jgi:hypothetical protein
VEQALPEASASLSLFTGFVLFAPAKFLAPFSLVGLVSAYRPYFEMVWLEIGRIDGI